MGFTSRYNFIFYNNIVNNRDNYHLFDGVEIDDLFILKFNKLIRSVLNDEELYVINKKYKLDGEDFKYTKGDIAKDLGVNVNTITKIHNNSIRKLRIKYNDIVSLGNKYIKIKDKEKVLYR